MYIHCLYGLIQGLAFVTDYFKRPEMCDKAIEIDPFTLRHVSDNLKTQRICIKAAEVGLELLEYVPVCPCMSVTQQQIKIWRDDDEYCDDDELIEWHDRYQKRKAEKAKIKEELLPIAWHPNRVIVCVCRRQIGAMEVTDNRFLTI